MVPKGFLRYRILKMLNNKPMSGSEIMNDLEAETSGYWKPSPGSIYPMLAWLQDKAYIKEAEQQEAGMRRYTLTEQGKRILEDETKSQEEINKRLHQFGPLHHFGPASFVFEKEDGLHMRSAARDFGKSVRSLFHELRREHSKEAVLEAKTSLEQVTKQIQEIREKLQNYQP
jgi:DNA-binding PadR family transcriptional regulator